LPVVARGFTTRLAFTTARWWRGCNVVIRIGCVEVPVAAHMLAIAVLGLLAWSAALQVSDAAALGLTSTNAPAVAVLLYTLLQAGRIIHEAGHALAGVATGTFATLELDPLSRLEGIRLATELAPELPAERAAQVWAQANGSPFWIEALARTGDADSAASDHLVSTRLRGLGADSNALFAVLSVGGRTMGLADLAHLLSWEPSRVDGAAAQLINRGVVVQTGGTLALAHDLIREAAMRQLPLPEGRRIHRQLAAWLEAEAGDDIGLLRLALEHRRDGGQATADLALRLASAPNRGLLGASGLRELATIADEARPRTHETLELQREVASMALEMGDWSVALDRFARLSEEDLTEPADRARAPYCAATAAYELRRAEVAQVYLAGCLQNDDHCWRSRRKRSRPRRSVGSRIG
jgi:hypothetical protein